MKQIFKKYSRMKIKLYKKKFKKEKVIIMFKIINWFKQIIISICYNKIMMKNIMINKKILLRNKNHIIKKKIIKKIMHKIILYKLKTFNIIIKKMNINTMKLKKYNLKI